MRFGHRGLDNLLNIEKGIVTAIVGKAGTGKTSLALVLACGAERPYMVDTEGVSLTRIKQIGVEHLKIAKVRKFEKQHKLLMHLNVDADILIIDSLVLLYRLKMLENYKRANKMLAQQISALHLLAEEKNIPVIVTGHVYSTEDGSKIVGGDIIKYWVKSLLFVEKTGPGKRKTTLVKHRSRGEGKNCKFRICEKGIC